MLSPQALIALLLTFSILYGSGCTNDTTATSEEQANATSGDAGELRDLKDALAEFPEKKKQQVQRVSRAVALAVLDVPNAYQHNSDGTYSLVGEYFSPRSPEQILQEGRAHLNSQPESRGPPRGFATAFVVRSHRDEPGLIATAGHCVTRNTAAKTTLFFNYESQADGTVKTTFQPDEVYEGAEWLAGRCSVERQAINDWALLRLKRPLPPEMVPLTLRTKNSSIVRGTPVFAIGHPGQSRKMFASGVTIKPNPSMDCSCDFHSLLPGTVGISGAPVFNGNDGVVEGIASTYYELAPWRSMVWVLLGAEFVPPREICLRSMMVYPLAEALARSVNEANDGD